MSDETTLAVYNAKVSDYQQLSPSDSENQSFEQFMSAVPTGGYVLDLGCGPGKSAAKLRSNGYLTDAVDASSAMVEFANKEFDINARLGSFNELCALETYDGVWANFSLLHATADDFPHILEAIHTSLKPGRPLHLGMKIGEGARRDDLGRFYTYYTQSQLEEHLDTAGFKVRSARTGIDRGLAGTLDPWITLLSVKPIGAN